MVRRPSDLGRCSVCDMDRAVYSDKGAGIRLCEACYAREMRQHKAEVRA